jgi:hypothetical protein
VISNPFSQLVLECEKKHISKTQHDPTVDVIDMDTGALLAPLNSALISLAEISLMSHFFFFFFVLSGGLFAVLKEYFPLITILSLSYAFIYFILFFT